MSGRKAAEDGQGLSRTSREHDQQGQERRCTSRTIRAAGVANSMQKLPDSRCGEHGRAEVLRGRGLPDRPVKRGHRPGPALSQAAAAGHAGHTQTGRGLK